jgi:hypothetical protein
MYEHAIGILLIQLKLPGGRNKVIRWGMLSCVLFVRYWTGLATITPEWPDVLLCTFIRSDNVLAG